MKQFCSFLFCISNCYLEKKKSVSSIKFLHVRCVDRFISFHDTNWSNFAKDVDVIVPLAHSQNKISSADVFFSLRLISYAQNDIV